MIAEKKIVEESTLPHYKKKKKELQEWMSALEAMIVCDNIKLERHVIIKKETVHYTLSCPSDCPVFKATIIMLVKK